MIAPKTSLLANASVYSNFTFSRLYRTAILASRRPYTELFAQRFQWSQPYLSIMRRASSIAIGGAVRVPNPVNGSLEYAGTYSVHGYSFAVIARLKSLKLSPNTRVVLFHRSSGVYLGGTIADSTTIENAGSPGSFRLATLADITDPIAAPVLRDGGPPMFDCVAAPVQRRVEESDVTFCSFVYDPLRNRFEDVDVLRTGVLSLFRTYHLVRVASITDRYGLDLRLVLVVPFQDFTDGLRGSVLTGIALAGAAVGALLLLACAIVHRVLEPLRDASKTVITLTCQRIDALTRASAAVERDQPAFFHAPQKNRKGGGGWAKRVANSCCCLPGDVPLLAFLFQVDEVVRVRAMIAKLQEEFAVIKAFLPPAGLDHLQSSSTQQPAAAVHETRKSHASVVLEVDRQSQSSSAAVSSHHYDQSGTTNAEIATGAQKAETSNNTDLNQPESFLHHSSSLFLLHRASQVIGASRIGVRIVTYVVADIVAFHRAWRSGATGGVDDLMTSHVRLTTAEKDAHSACLSIVLLAADACGGVVSGFYGDKFHVHFNAEKPLRGHAAAAVRFALMVEELQESTLKVHMGVATTRAVCGVMGPPRLQGFHVLGECVQTASSLAQHVKCLKPELTTLMAYPTTRLMMRPSSLRHSNASSTATHRRLSSVISLSSSSDRRSSVASTLGVLPMTDVFARHVTIDVMPYDDAPSIVSTPVLWSTLENKGIGSAVGDAITDPVCIREAYLLSNAAYEAAAENSLLRAHQLLRNSPFTTEEHWLLRVLTLVAGGGAAQPET